MTDQQPTPPLTNEWITVAEIRRAFAMTGQDIPHLLGWLVQRMQGKAGPCESALRDAMLDQLRDASATPSSPPAATPPATPAPKCPTCEGSAPPCPACFKPMTKGDLAGVRGECWFCHQCGAKRLNLEQLRVAANESLRRLQRLKDQPDKDWSTPETLALLTSDLGELAYGALNCVGAGWPTDAKPAATGEGEKTPELEKAYAEFDKWLDVTGLVERDSGYYAEVRSLIDDGYAAGLAQANRIAADGERRGMERAAVMLDERGQRLPVGSLYTANVLLELATSIREAARAMAGEGRK